MKVSKIMHGVTFVNPEKSVLDVAKLMTKKRIGSVLVKEDDKLLGILTERDILRKVVAKGLDSNKVKVKEIMSSPCCTIDADAELEDASKIFNKHHIRRLPVTKNGKVIGIITTRDVAKGVMYAGLRRRERYYGHLR